MISCGLLPATTVRQVWPLLEDFVTVALKRSNGEIKAEDVRELAVAGKMQLWAIWDVEEKKLYGLAVTEVMDYPQKASLRIVTLGGTNMDFWSELLLSRLMDYAKLLNLDYIEAVGRFGFARKLEKLGFKPTYLLMTKPLREEMSLNVPINEVSNHVQNGRYN